VTNCKPLLEGFEQNNVAKHISKLTSYFASRSERIAMSASVKQRFENVQVRVVLITCGHYWFLAEVFRSVLSAPPQAMSWPNMSLTDVSFRGSGLKTLKFSKSVYMESNT